LDEVDPVVAKFATTSPHRTQGAQRDVQLLSASRQRLPRAL